MIPRLCLWTFSVFFQVCRSPMSILPPTAVNRVFVFIGIRFRKNFQLFIAFEHKELPFSFIGNQISFSLNQPWSPKFSRCFYCSQHNNSTDEISLLKKTKHLVRNPTQPIPATSPQKVESRLYQIGKSKHCFANILFHRFPLIWKVSQHFLCRAIPCCSFNYNGVKYITVNVYLDTHRI